MPLLCGMWLAACVNASLRENDCSPRRVSAQVLRPKEHVELVGEVVDEPVVFSRADASSEVQHFTLRIVALRRADEWRRASGIAAAVWTVPRGSAAVEYGQRWKWRGVLSRDTVRRAGYRALPAQRFNVDGGDEQQLAGGGGNPLIRLCLEARKRSARQLEAGVEDYPHSHGMVKAMLLGIRSEIPEAQRDVFAETGTLHILAVSGVHVGILTLLCVAVLRLLGVPSRKFALYLGPLLLLYAVLTGLRASAVRAAVMAVALLAAPAWGRRPDLPSAVALAATLILAAAPGQILDAGFIFSFAAVIGLLILQPRLMKRLSATGEADEDWSVQRPGRAQRLARWVSLAVWGTVSTSIAVWVVTTPLTARWFHLCSPIALVGNLLVIPLASVIIFSGVLSTVFGWIHPVVSEVFNHGARVFVDLLMLWVEGLAAIPYGHFTVGDIPDAWFAAWYALLFLALTARAYLRSLVPWFAAACVTLAALVWWSGRDAAFLTVLEESDGAAVLVRGPAGRHVLVNAGPAYRGRDVVRALQRRGINHLDALVIAHADASHAGAAADILRAVPVRELWCTPWLKQSPVCMAVLGTAGEKGIRVRRLVAGSSGALGDVEWEVLHPADDRPARRSGEGALVMRFARQGASALLMNGADARVEQSILQRAIEPAAEVLLSGGRRMSGACSPEWLDAVRPRVALIGTGGDWRWVEPDREAVRRLRERGVDVRGVNEAEGALEIHFERRPSQPGGPWCRIL